MREGSGRGDGGDGGGDEAARTQARRQTLALGQLALFGRLIGWLIAAACGGAVVC